MNACIEAGDLQGRSLAELVGLAAERAVPPISNFHVGAVGVGASGRHYLGWNLEFRGQVFHQTVHAEQFVVALAAARGETALERLAISHAPCGHCRQFLCELAGYERLRIEVVGRPETDLLTLIPYHFGPRDLGVQQPLLAHPRLELAADDPDPLVQAAAEAARRCYAPYSNCPAGLAFEAEGEIYAGSLLESSAYNPSLSPFQAALVDYYARHRHAPRIERAMLVEWNNQASQRHAALSLLETLAPGVALGYTQFV